MPSRSAGHRRRGPAPPAEPPRRLHLRAALALLGTLAASGSAAGADALALEAVPERSSDGVYRLRWSAEAPVVLEESRRADFADARVIYRGSDRSSLQSGRSDGTYHYRVRALDGAAAARTAVTVEHHALPRAFAFFGVGLAVFVCTTALVVRGAGDEEEAAHAR